jgi:hypothetical protein
VEIVRLPRALARAESLSAERWSAKSPPGMGFLARRQEIEVHLRLSLAFPVGTGP